MKFFHLSDLHLGKRVNEYSMLDDQAYILQQILDLIDQEQPEAILIAGDVYDKPVPPAEAVALFDDFLVSLAQRKLQVFIISGNHDSAQRLAFGNRLIETSGIHLSPVFDGTVSPITLTDQYGPIHLYLLPFIKPVHVRRFTDESIESYTNAMAKVIRDMNPDFSQRNILMTHQFVTGSQRCESEELSVGGTDNVDASVFDGFDYVALGHLHSPQRCSRDTIRYCGTPLKYSFSEAKDHKSVTVLEMAEKGSVTIRTLPLTPKRDLVELKGTYQELMAKSFYQGKPYQEDYTHITLTDEEDVPDAIGKLRSVYHNLMKLDYDNTRTRTNQVIECGADVENKSPLELFSDFYEQQNNQPMSKTQEDFVKQLIETIWEGEQ